MFKSKTDFNAFDKNNKKVENIDAKKAKGLSKAGTKKLAANLESRTSFYLILNYFLDDADKPLGHFLDFGINKKLAKHFEQVEMKSGKLDKSMSASQKEAAMGEVYAKEENGKKKLYFEPSADCKVPKGKWPKILKEIRPLINSLRAVVVLDGVALEETSEEEPTTDAPEEDTAQDTDNTGASLAELKVLFQPISVLLKTTLRDEIIPRIKAKQVTAEDRQTVADLQAQVNESLERYAASSAETQVAFAKAKKALQGQQPLIKKIAKALSSGPTETTTEEQTMSESDEKLLRFLEKLLKKTEKDQKAFDGVFEKFQAEPAPTPTPIPSGSGFLAGINV